MSKIKGMVQFGDLTYRIVKVRSGAYDAIRILDEVRIGTFQTTPRLSLQAAGADTTELRAVAMVAMRQAKVSWFRRGAVTPAVAPGVASTVVAHWPSVS